MPPLSERHQEPDAMPTVMAGMAADMLDDEAHEQRLTMEQEREWAGMGFVPDRQWNMIRQWMYRGTVPL